MKFDSSAQKKCYRQVESWLEEMFGGDVEAQEDDPIFLLTYESTALVVAVYPFGDDDAVISTRAIVVKSPKLLKELLYFLLRKNDDVLFGAFGIDGDDDIFFEHTIVGNTADKAGFEASITSVAATADEYDDEIVERWGGQLALE